MALRNGAAQRQPCAHAFKLAFAVQALEHTKQCAGACGVKPHAVVLHGKGHMASRCDNSLHGNAGLRCLARELEGVAQQLHQQLLQQGRVGLQRGQIQRNAPLHRPPGLDSGK